ncbi:MAG: hypothetical protein PHP37_00710 [Patescibacteria group bacterium]|nr:hypothetical protein [Patescibacteria group bacterium]
MATITKKNEISDADVAKMIKKMESGYPIHNEKGVMIGIEIEGGESVMISNWEHKVLAVFENVRFRTPREDDQYLKFVDTAVTLTRGGKILEIPGYWRRGVWIAKKLVTVTYRMAGQMSAKSVPIGVDAVGKVEIRESSNSHTGEKRIIIDYYFYPSPVQTFYEVKIGGKKRESTVFSKPIPGTEELIVVNKIGK